MAKNKPKQRQDLIKKAKKKTRPPSPRGVKPGTQRYIDLYNYWYGKLADSGFQDIEHYDPKTASGHDSPKFNTTGPKAVDEYAFEHFRLCRNYLTHAKFKTKKLRLIWELYTEGYSYREIVAHLKKLAESSNSSYRYLYYNTKGKPSMSIFRLCRYILPPLIEDCYRWNKENQEGILNLNAQEFYINDLVLNSNELDSEE